MSGLVNYTYWKWDSILSPDFCRSALAAIDWATAEPAGVNNIPLPADPTIRVTDVMFQDPMQPIGCIARTYMEVANQAAGWNFALSGQEDTQFARYKSSNLGHYDWHMDAAMPKNGVQRKLSCVILLSDPTEFEGGVLQFKGLEDEILLCKQGSIIVFPSFVEHKVTPVTKGVRHTAVAWANGPSFR